MIPSMTDENPYDKRDVRTIIPFLAAVVVIVLIGLGIFIADRVSPSDRNVTEADRIKVAVTNFVAAHNSKDSEIRKAAQCPGFEDDKSPLAGRDGKVVVTRVEKAQIDGDRGKADVTTGIDGKKDEKTSNWNFHRDDGDWRVCN